MSWHTKNEMLAPVTASPLVPVKVALSVTAVGVVKGPADESWAVRLPGMGVPGVAEPSDQVYESLSPSPSVTVTTSEPLPEGVKVRADSCWVVFETYPPHVSRAVWLLTVEAGGVMGVEAPPPTE